MISLVAAMPRCGLFPGKKAGFGPPPPTARQLEAWHPVLGEKTLAARLFVHSTQGAQEPSHFVENFRDRCVRADVDEREWAARGYGEPMRLRLAR